MGLLTILRPNRKAPLQVSVQFEEGKAYRPSVIESAAKAAQFAIRQNPLMLAQCPFFEASKAADWLCGKDFGSAGASENGVPAGKVRRLRAIHFGSETLLENTYGEDGRIASTFYHGGDSAVYEWDDLRRINRIRSKAGHQIAIKLRADDLPESVTYDGNARFQYDYDVNGNIIRLIYPDGVRIERSFNQHGLLATMSCATLRTELSWKASGELAAFSFHGGGKEFQFETDAKQHECDLTSASAVSGSLASLVVHSLGAWRVNGPKCVEEMITPWGDRFRIQSFAQNLPTIVWSPSGQQSFQYGPDNSFSGLMDGDGTRTVFYQIKDDAHRGLLVSPHGFALLEFDDGRRLRKVLNFNGDYCLLNYDRDGSLTRVATFIETIDISATRGKSAVSIETSSGYSCKLNYSSNGTLTQLIPSGLRRNTADELCRLLKFLWRWLGLRSTLSIALG